MTHRNFHGHDAERLHPCPGSKQRPAVADTTTIGLCRSCGVRTFVRGGLVQSHYATVREVTEYRRRGRIRVYL